MQKKRGISSKVGILKNIQEIDKQNRERPRPIRVLEHTPAGLAVRMVNPPAYRERNRQINAIIKRLKKSNAHQRLRLAWLRQKNIAKTQFKRVNKKEGGLAKNSFKRANQKGKGRTKGRFNRAANNNGL